MIDLAIDRQFAPPSPAPALDAAALLVRAERAEAEVRGLRAERGAMLVMQAALARSRDWWMQMAGPR